jgi:hypothetical protein
VPEPASDLERSQEGLAVLIFLAAFLLIAILV